MPERLQGMFIDMSTVSKDDYLTVYDAIDERIHRDEIFKGTRNSYGNLHSFEFVHRASEAAKLGAIADIKAFVILNNLPVDVRPSH